MGSARHARFFGEWFGGRPYDNQHEISAVKAQEDVIFLLFGGGETLTVHDPMDATVDDEGLRIRRASRVEWTWFYYGRPQQWIAAG